MRVTLVLAVVIGTLAHLGACFACAWLAGGMPASDGAVVHDIPSPEVIDLWATTRPDVAPLWPGPPSPPVSGSQSVTSPSPGPHGVADVSFMHSTSWSGLGISVECIASSGPTAADWHDVALVNVGWPMRAFHGHRWRSSTFSRSPALHGAVAAQDIPLATPDDEYKFLLIDRVIPYTPHTFGLVTNSLLYGAVAFFLLRGPRFVQRRTRAARRLCPECGYPVTDGAVCPECGLPYSIEAHTRS